MVEYILFVIGIVVLLISLFYSHYSQKQNNDDYYLQNEMIAEIRSLKNEIKESLEIELEEQDFQQVFKENLANEQQTKDSLAEIQSIFNDLSESLENLEERISGIEVKIDKLTDDCKKDNNQAINIPTKPIYQKIKEYKKEGLQMVQIAKKLDMGTREVELIYKLNSRGEA